MELFLFNHQEYERLYNCTNLVIDSIPIENRRLTIEALINLILGIIYFLLYLPCLYSIWKQHWKNDCYTILLYIGIVDLVGIIISGFLHPILSLQGAVFCSYPTLIYIVGTFVNCFWVAETSADLVLAFNRCIQIISPSIAKFLFKGMRTYIWLLFCTLYALYCMFFVNPVLFSGIYFAWFFYPFVGYREDYGEFVFDQLPSYHDVSVAILSPLIYLIFAIALVIKSKKSIIIPNQTPTQYFSISRLEKMVFLQVFSLSLLNTTECLFYIIMQYTTQQKWMTILAEFLWFHIHGFPPIIYLTLNKTIREDCLILLKKLKNINKDPPSNVVNVMVTPFNANS
uniref:Serpentine receptor class gamma n=1 Tax=Meloidogyne floridensis TaxID=298350 RepID=A0A915P9R4_9BILA